MLQEVRGLANGAGIDFDTMYFFQISEEFENYAAYTRHKCTAIGVHKTESQPTLLAQNMDPPNFLHGHPTVLHISDSTGLQSFVFTAPGLIGLNGMNNHSVGVTCNALPSKSIKWTGLPVTFIVRGLLQKTTSDDAIEFIKEIEHAGGQNYIIGGVNKARCFECSTLDVKEFVPAETKNLTYHTNHYLVETEPQYCSRLLSLQNEIKERDYIVDVNDIKSILSQNKWNRGRPICNPFTYGSLIMILCESPELLIAPGMPDRTPYQRLVFENISPGS